MYVSVYGCVLPHTKLQYCITCHTLALACIQFMVAVVASNMQYVITATKATTSFCCWCSCFSSAERNLWNRFCISSGGKLSNTVVVFVVVFGLHAFMWQHMVYLLLSAKVLRKNLLTRLLTSTLFDSCLFVLQLLLLLLLLVLFASCSSALMTCKLEWLNCVSSLIDEWRLKLR